MTNTETLIAGLRHYGQSAAADEMERLLREVARYEHALGQISMQFCDRHVPNAAPGHAVDNFCSSCCAHEALQKATGE